MNDASNARLSVRHFVPCDKVERWGNRYSLIGLRFEIPNPFDEPTPRLYPKLYFFLAITNGTGPCVLQIQQSCLRDQTRVFRSPERTIDMGDNPTTIHEVVWELQDVVFWAPGQCEFHLYSGRDRLAEAVIEVR